MHLRADQDAHRPLRPETPNKPFEKAHIRSRRPYISGTSLQELRHVRHQSLCPRVRYQSEPPVTTELKVVLTPHLPEKCRQEQRIVSRVHEDTLPPLQPPHRQLDLRPRHPPKSQDLGIRQLPCPLLRDGRRFPPHRLPRETSNDGVELMQLPRARAICFNSRESCILHPTNEYRPFEPPRDTALRPERPHRVVRLSRRLPPELQLRLKGNRRRSPPPKVPHTAF